MDIKKLFNDFKIVFYMSFVMIGISAVSILFVPVVNVNSVGAKKFFAYVIAVLFWIGIFGSQFFFWKSNYQRKQLLKKEQNTINNLKRIGIISFFKNKEAMVMDIALFISASLVAIISVFEIESDLLFIISIVILFLSFNFHCILNGVNYAYIKDIKNNLKTRSEKQ